MKKTGVAVGCAGLMVMSLAVCSSDSPANGDAGGGAVASDGYDVVIAGGRVLDPESGLDAVNNVGITDGRIAAITDLPISGTEVLDARGAVVTPGFIDMHVHGQSPDMYEIQVMDGVTSSLELEVGTGDVATWYAERDAQDALINYGVSSGHIPARMTVLEDPGEFLPSGPAASQAATPSQVEEMAALVQTGMDQGGIAVGFGWAYTPAATSDEIEAIMAVAAANDASAHIHILGGDDPMASLQAAMDAAMAAGAALHVVHINSSGTSTAPAMLRHIQAAVEAGSDVTTEAYPYEAGMTRIESALFDGWEQWDDAEFERHMWVATGERLTRETFGARREEGGEVIIFTNPPELVQQLASNPVTMIASDGFIVDGNGHPRSSGTFARVLGRYVREAGSLTLMDAIAKMTLRPAQRLEARVPSMADRGRLRVGAFADVAVFDQEVIIDRATYTDPTATSDGMKHVLVAGVPVVRDGALVEGVAPGRAIRAPR